MAVAWLLSLALQADLEAWVSRLAAPETRQGALDRLLHAEPAALRKLAGLDPSIVEGAELRARLAPSYGPGRRFSLDGREEPLAEILSRLESVSGLAFIRNAPAPGVQAALRLDEVSVWKALAELGKAASFSIANAEGRQIYLHSPAPGVRPQCFHGPLMIEIDRISRRDRVGFDGTSTDFGLRLAVWWEPSVHPFGVDGVARVRRAVDDQGRSLLRERASTPPRMQLPAPGHGSAAIDNLEPPARDARSLSLDGELLLRFPARVQEAVLEASGAAVFDGLRVKAELTELPAGGVAVAVTLDFEEAARAAAFRPSASDLIFETSAPWRGMIPVLVENLLEDRRRIYQVRALSVPRSDLLRFRLRLPEGEVSLAVPFAFEKVPLR